VSDDAERGWRARLKQAMSKTRASVAAPVNRVLGRGVFDDETWNDLEEALIMADMGVSASTEIIDRVKMEALRRPPAGAAELRELLRTAITAELRQKQPTVKLTPPAVILLVGVNGTGKTTTAGKLARRFADNGASVVIAAADTFRAAAIEQVAVWAERSGAYLVKHQRGGDSAAVAFDAARAAAARGADYLIIDTAGRLQTKTPLMEELKKVKGVIERELPSASIATWLVVDATTGQNGISQATAFSAAVGLDGLILTKLDGTAKGGIVMAITRATGLPVIMVGVGEAVEDLLDFDADAFAGSLLD
jgi:fused signal recognition particle receptor